MKLTHEDITARILKDGSTLMIGIDEFFESLPTLIELKFIKPVYQVWDENGNLILEILPVPKHVLSIVISDAIVPYALPIISMSHKTFHRDEFQICVYKVHTETIAWLRENVVNYFKYIGYRQKGN